MRVALVLVLTVAFAVASSACSSRSRDANAPVDATTATATAGAATSDATTTPSTGPAAGLGAPAPIAWGACGDGLECGTVDVPISYTDPAAGTLALAVARRTSSATSALGPLVVNPGGPGASGIAMLRRGFGRDDLLGDVDVVSWDPRGVADSGRLGCATDTLTSLRAEDPSPDDPAEQQALDAAARALAQDCAAAADPALLRSLTAADSARDLDRIRQALGVEQISYLGFSYGTLIGLELLRAFPDHLRALVIDGVVDPAASLVDLLTEQTEGLDRHLDDVFEACRTDSACALDDPAATYDSLAASVEQTPIPSRAGHPVTPLRLAFAAISAAYTRDGDQRLVAALADGSRGDGTALDRLAESYLASVADYGAYVGTSCVDGSHPTGADAWAHLAADLAARSPRIGAAVANELVPCASWPVGPTREPSAVTDAHGVPVLVVVTTGDVVTPPANAEAVAAAFGPQASGVHVLTVDATGHTSIGKDDCTTEVARRFLADPATPLVTTRCP